MRFLGRLSLLMLATGMALAQTSATAPTQGADPSMADQLKALKDAMAAQQRAVAEQQAQIAQQQQKIENLEKALSEKSSGAARVENAALTTNTAPAAAVVQGDEKPKESPLSVRIGGTDFTPGGWVDFENVFRSTNTGNVTATNFWAIPFSNTAAGHLTEYRSTGQYSRFNLKITGKYGANNVTGYIEGDFNGNDANNVFITSNPHTFRLRLYWLDLKRGKWEFLAGDTWGLQTPNRVGVSPAPGDVFTTIGEDAQTHVGVNYTRAAAFRAAYHFNDHFVWAAELQNPQQYIGQSGGGGTVNEVVFPAQFSAAITPQFDNNNVPGTPNVFPDIISKFALDKDYAGRHLHFEAGGLMTSAKITLIPSVAGSTFVKHAAIGGGFLAGINAELFKNFRWVASGMWGPGVGRYLIAMGPQAVVFPVPATAGGTCLTGGAGGCDANISMVHAGDVITGFEMQPFKNTLWGAYYGGAYFQRNAFPDLTAAGVTKPTIGFGGNGEAGNTVMNKSIQEATFDWTQTFWRNPQYGAVLLVTQTSYVTRAPWFVAAGAPKNAHLMMGYVSLRYVLP
jgi:hypothetical protein